MMNDLNQEGCENDTENSSIIDEFRRNRCRLHEYSDATGVYIDLLRRSGQTVRTAEGAVVNEPGQNLLADTSSANTNRASISQLIRNQEANENNESRLIPEIETDHGENSLILEPFTVISVDDVNSTHNQPCVVQNGPPPSYTSLPPPIPAIGLPPIIHPLPPPTYEQTFGLRYLDRDQPVLVFNTENMWGYRPQLAYCMSCNAMVLTNVNTQYCQATHLVAILSFVLCCWPCCVLPYFIPALKEARHHCPACNSHLGTYHPFTRTE
ncbi:unnamed protein product [Nezara viridula]|uniref:LITAF domain-containing protein n=1 Tax=Nezara viridula TaxID=85310 RepID=A0A9P0H5Y2_NEZVI|nr:unnamed protein product [Nezara viridula]